MAALFTLIEYFAPMQWSPCQRPTPNRPTQFPNCNAYIAFRNPSVNSDKAGEREIYIIYKKGFSREEFWSQLSQSNRFVAVNSHSHSLNIVSTSTHQLYIFTHTRTGICEKEGEKHCTEMTHIYVCKSQSQCRAMHYCVPGLRFFFDFSFQIRIESFQPWSERFQRLASIFDFPKHHPDLSDRSPALSERGRTRSAITSRIFAHAAAYYSITECGRFRTHSCMSRWLCFIPKICIKKLGPRRHFVGKRLNSDCSLTPSWFPQERGSFDAPWVMVIDSDRDRCQIKCHRLRANL